MTLVMTPELLARLAKVEADLATIKAALQIQESEDRARDGFLRFRERARKGKEATA